ncbi:hypothetical protein N7497_000545 [Penicillium chrysogenum]|uniref:MYND-type zinc finger protein samB n=1 Tax=Penicillium chrysogenum TaxID=5076 RepID=A0ABQ8X1R5_PENCH|nr:hypothetical protein N7505_002156 [Penicillium chrysogenum]KAJ6167702.1 hypothetical protein N7497_000545 [Penicillium chrysogenum]
MPYCSVEHQSAHRQDHKYACNKIKKCRIDMEAQEQALRNHPDDGFAYGVGRFWKMLPTRPYMNARLDYRAALTFVSNVESVQAQLDTLMENLRLCRGDNIGSGDLVPGLMVRLGRDQECYDFLKWWATSAKDPKYNWADPTLPYLDIKNANPVEPVEPFIRGRQGLSHLVALMLLKIKLYFLLLVTHGAQAYEEASENLRETMDGMMELRNSTMARNPHIANMTSLEAAPAIQKLKAQIRQLYHTRTLYFCPETIKPDETLNAAPSMYMAGSKEEMQATMMWIWNACHETFGALQIIHGALNHPNDEFPL